MLRNATVRVAAPSVHIVQSTRVLLAGANCPSRATGYYRADDLPDTCNYSHSSGVAAAQSADTAPVVGQDTTGLDTD